MLNPLEALRRLRQPDPEAYSPDEVLAILRGERTDERAEAALEVITSPAAWLPADLRRSFGSLAWYAERLPTIMHLYRRGWTPGQIGKRLTPLGGAWAIEQTLAIAAGLIAERLNSRRLAA